LDESNTKLFPRFSVDQVKAALIDRPVVMVTGAAPVWQEGDCTAVNAQDGYYYAYCHRNRDAATIVARAPV